MGSQDRFSRCGGILIDVLLKDLHAANSRPSLGSGNVPGRGGVFIDHMVETIARSPAFKSA
jgi:hypothetical protein